MQQKLCATGEGGSGRIFSPFQSVSFLSTSAFYVLLTMQNPPSVETQPRSLFHSRVDGFAIPVLAVPQDHEKQQKLWFVKVQQVTAPDGAQTEEHFKAQKTSTCVIAARGHLQLLGPSSSPTQHLMYFYHTDDLVPLESLTCTDEALSPYPSPQPRVPAENGFSEN